MLQDNLEEKRKASKQRKKAKKKKKICKIINIFIYSQDVHSVSVEQIFDQKILNALMFLFDFK